MVVQRFRKPQAAGSSPVDGSKADVWVPAFVFARIAQPVEQRFCKPWVAGATPAAGSMLCTPSDLVMRRSVKPLELGSIPRECANANVVYWSHAGLPSLAVRVRIPSFARRARSLVAKASP